MAGQSQDIVEVAIPDGLLQVTNVSLPNSLLQVANGRLTDTKERPQMQKVPPFLRWENGDQHYDPLVVSLGPYHHGKPQLKLAEDFKLKALEMFVEDSGRDVQFFYTKVLEQVTFCKGCYFQDSTSAYDDHTFAQMMLLDSCFIITFILYLYRRATNISVPYDFLGDWAHVNIGRDLFLLENQIPFRLVELLIRSRQGDLETEAHFLYGFLFSRKIEECNWKELAGGDDDRPIHILDGHWLANTSQLRSKEKGSCFPCYELGCLKHIGNTIRYAYKYSCISIFRRLLRRKTDLAVQTPSTLLPQSFRSATDLKAKGIHCRPSPFLSWRSINFKSGYFFATLEVPVRNVSINTKSFLLNMIAYELFPTDSNADRPMTAYVDFMKSLIDNPTDVKELRERKILFTTLGNDEDVVNLFNGIKTYYLGLLLHSHDDVEMAIEAHYNNKAKTWLAELLHTYFRSPWNAIALVAATVLLILTIIQTYYAAQPSSENKKFS